MRTLLAALLGLLLLGSAEPARAQPSGYDDAPFLQARLNDMATAGGGTLHLTTGTYQLGTGLVIPPHTVFECDSRASTVLMAIKPNIAMLTYHWHVGDGPSTGGVEIRDCTLDSNGQAGVAGVYLGFDTRQSLAFTPGTLTVHDMDLFGMSQAVEVHEATGAVVDNLRIVGGVNGVMLNGTRLRVTGIQTTNMRGVDVRLGSVSNSTVASCMLDSPQTNIIEAITSSNNTFIDNWTRFAIARQPTSTERGTVRLQ